MWDIDSSQFCLIYLDIIIVSSPFFGNLGNLFWSQSVQEVSNMVTRGSRHLTKSTFSAAACNGFFNPRNVLWTSLLWKWPWNAMRLGSKTHFQWYLQGILSPIIFKTLFVWEELLLSQFFSSVANSWNKSLSTLFFLHTYWYAWLNSCGLGRPSISVFTRPQMCTMSTAYQFAAFQQLYSVLASSVFAFCEWTQSDSVCAYFMYMNNKETYQLMYHEKGHSVSTRMSLHVHEPKANISIHVARKSAQHFIQWRWTIKSVLSRTFPPPHPPRTPPTNTQRINTYVTSWRWTIEDLVEHLHVTRTTWTTFSCNTTSM